MINQNKKCFIREGKNTVETDALVMRQKCMEAEEERYLSEIKKLQTENKLLLEALFAVATN